LYRGARMVAGEIGQTSIDYQAKISFTVTRALWRPMSGSGISLSGQKRFTVPPARPFRTRRLFPINYQQPRTRGIHWRWRFGPTSVSSLGAGYPMWLGC